MDTGVWIAFTLAVACALSIIVEWIYTDAIRRREAKKGRYIVG